MFGIILSLLLLIVSLIGWSVYKYSILLHADGLTDPYVYTLSGETIVLRGDLKITVSQDEQYSLEKNDTLVTYEWIASIVYPDGSVVRMAENTRLVLEEVMVNRDLTEIRIANRIEQGKIWTNVVRALFGNSYFVTRIPSQRVTAAVRGTVYEIDLENDYIHSIDHAVTLENDAKQTTTLISGEVARVSNIFERLKSDILDPTWIYLNTKFDEIYRVQLKKKLDDYMEKLAPKNFIDRISLWILSFFDSFRTTISYAESYGKNSVQSLESMSEEALLRFYQDLSVLGNTREVVEMKIKVRAALFQMIPEKEQYKFSDALARGALYDSYMHPELKWALEKSIETFHPTKAIEELKNQFSSFDYKKSLKTIEDIMNDPTKTIDAVGGFIEEANKWTQNMLETLWNTAEKYNK